MNTKLDLSPPLNVQANLQHKRDAANEYLDSRGINRNRVKCAHRYKTSNGNIVSLLPRTIYCQAFGEINELVPF